LAAVSGSEALIRCLIYRPISDFLPLDFLKSHGVNDGLLGEFEQLAIETRQYGLQLLQADLVIDPTDVKRAIESIASDARMASPEVRRQLKELSTLSPVVKEMAEAFTVARRNLPEWRWPPAGIRSDLQKHLSGKERAFLTIDTTEAIFLETISQQWSTHFTTRLAKIRTTSYWPKTYSLQGLETSKEKELESMLNMLETSKDDEPDLHITRGQGIADTGADRSSERFIAAMRSGSYGSYSNVPMATSPNEKAATGSGWGGVIDASRTAASHSDVFRYLRADIAFTKTVAPAADMCILHSDLENFGPSVPHKVTLDVLRFFGMPSVWLSWFECYLRVPLLDSASGTITTATCGSPFGLSASLLINELLLVVLDTVLAAASGVAMNRLHDDFWVWSTSSEQVERAWTIMNDFTSKTGLSWNEEKTGCTIVPGLISSAQGTLKDISILPQGPIKWGILKIERKGQWVVDDDRVGDLATSMREELRSNPLKSFLSRVNLWNKYHGYIARNVGPITTENWEIQIPLLLSVLRKFQTLILGQRTIHDTLVAYFHGRFPAHSDYPPSKAVFSWPVQLGGFQLHHHLVRTLVCAQAISPPDMPTPAPACAKEVSEARRSYDRYSSAWTSQWGERAWLGREGNAQRALWGKTDNRPPPVSEAETYAGMLYTLVRGGRHMRDLYQRSK
jgi:hypothetical protein